MVRGTFLCILFLCALPVFAGHPGMTDLSPRQATPGLRLELIEIPSLGGNGAKKYTAHASDFPRGLMFGVYTKDFSDTFAEILSDFHVDDSGNMVSTSGGKQQRLQDLILTPGPYPRGAAWDIAIATADRSVSAFAQVIPQPIAVQSSGCSVSLQLLSPRGDRFLVTGSGFSSSEEVLTELTIENRIEQRLRKASADGQLTRHVISHAAMGKDRTAKYSVKGRSCKVTTEYEWGERALIRW
jgi:hypothetical protein